MSELSVPTHPSPGHGIYLSREEEASTTGYKVGPIEGDMHVRICHT